ncbi:DUF3558 family protein [Corynebacterium sp. Z-1]|uniref:DUF3558 family protein n=1 Tax=Corynebacterium sp. Z-1 TaxID=3074378 RepID=UPI002882DEB8|nr:DUF3558 family protein [Corynebacterium sp. Z-1]WNI12652.1 DUF3558 family protein [Corynebacterium sp. Z-1]
MLFCCWRGCGQAESAVFLGLRQCGGLSVRRFGVVVGLVGVVGVVSGCASGADVGAAGQTGAAGPASSEAAVSPEPAAFHFDSGDLVIGPFDPEEVKHNLFDPCTEISDAEFAAAGLVKSEVQPEQSALNDRYISTCALDDDDDYGVVLVVANAADRNIILSSSPSYTVSSLVPPGAFAFGAPSGLGDSCDVAVETDRGTLSVSVGSARMLNDPSTLCSQAEELMNALYEQHSVDH